MFISKIKLTNWKNFQAVEVDLTQRVFIVGANASGKSNFLDAIRFLRDIVKQSGGLQYAVEQRGGVSKIRCLSARQKPNVAIEVHLSQIDPQTKGTELLWKYYLELKHSSGGILRNRAKIVRESVINLKTGKKVLDRTEEIKSRDEDKTTLEFTSLEQVNSNRDFRDIYSFFQEIQYLHVIPQLIRDVDSYILAAHKEDFYGRNLLNRMNKHNEKIRDSYLKKINEVLKLAVPQFEDIQLVKDTMGIPHLEVKYKHWRSKAAKQIETQFSDGTLRLIGFMWALLDGQETILLEEPELYLHAEIVKQLPEFIHNLQRKKGRTRQVIISTHSYDILSNEGIGGEEVILLLPTKEGTKIYSATQLEDVKKHLQAGFSMADATIPMTSPENIHNINQLGFE